MSDFISGDLEPREFLARYWQQQPLLVRNFLPGYQSPISADELAGLATMANVESRLVLENGAAGPWELRHGPFADADFAQLPEHDWTLLVQALDLWVPEVESLLGHFDFLPRWRIDDVMASFAVKGGSVGPHFDHYDVFLLQVEGNRRWQIGELCDANTTLVKATDLGIIRDFTATHDWLLKPGDMLYLPPGIGHWGVAESDCITFSVGFRSPTLADLLGDLALELSAQGVDARYRDPPLTPEMASSTVDRAFVAQARAQLHQLIDNENLIADWFARFMTAPKYEGLEEDTGEHREAEINGNRYVNGEQQSTETPPD